MHDFQFNLNKRFITSIEEKHFSKTIQNLRFNLGKTEEKLFDVNKKKLLSFSI